MRKIHGVKRVIIFCLLTAFLPAILIIIPLYLRHNVFADVTHPVTESDVLAIVDGVSSVFCESHSLYMNTTFNAFQLKGKPVPSKKLKHIRLKKSMILPDDTLEYWGFYLSRGAIVKLKVCASYKGSSILVVRGERTFQACNLLNRQEKYGARLDKEHNRVKITFEKSAEVIGVVDDHVVAAGESVNEDNAAEDLTDVDDSSIPNKMNHNIRHANARRKLIENFEPRYQFKRDIAALDAPIEHGGNNNNPSNASILEENSVSSFETELLTCYDGQILVNEEFSATPLCNSVHYLEHGRKHMETLHEVASNGYYYYIFYSDNDDFNNDVHAIFDIYKPTYHYANLTKGNDCINRTECTFPISFLRDETVIVEVPTKDGIDHEGDDFTVLISKCHPRMAVYMVFPISVLFLILVCAFL